MVFYEVSVITRYMPYVTVMMRLLLWVHHAVFAFKSLTYEVPRKRILCERQGLGVA